ncbi:MAG: stage 0 sporulation family protein [Clostridiales bacterium]|nr:stage 0 sporulation family protein [Clostridiales bacterium]
MPIIAGVKFKKTNKIYYFSPENLELNEGDGVIVETARGIEYGTIVITPREVDESKIVQPLKPILRKATEEDIQKLKEQEAKIPEALKIAEEKIKKHNLEMKLIDVEYTFDGNKIIFYFTADGRVDFRELVKDLAYAFKIRIELRQIGVRDECKMVGGLGPCGRECCCVAHLSEYSKVNIKMAKNQGLSLNPSKISGLCGRLMCCLEYENEHYLETAQRMPKINSEVITPQGPGIVVYNNMIKEIVKVKVLVKDDYEIMDFKLEDITAKETLAEELDQEVIIDESIQSLID